MIQFTFYPKAIRLWIMDKKWASLNNLVNLTSSFESPEAVNA